MTGRILIVDDDDGFRRALARNLRHAGHDVQTCANASEARQAFPHADADVVVLDYNLPDANGLELLDELRLHAGGTVFLMATAYPLLDIAVDAMRRGAFDYVAKDAELIECLMRIERGTEVALLRRRMAEASHATGSSNAEQALLGESAAMRALRARLNALSGSGDTTVLITGETGTGKGVVARAIHAASGRAYEPFVAVDCTTIASTLVESELFGHEKGAFSGATASTTGRVEAAGRGTLFLDEIGELELSMQAKLLRLLEEREFTRVGSTRTRQLAARTITATNRNLEQAVAQGWFRADLRYRLEVFVVETPALRDRGDDVFLLAAHFLVERARALGRAEQRLHPEVIAALPRYPFPGNVRELRNMVEQAVLLGQSELTLADFPVIHRYITEQAAAATGTASAGLLPPAPASQPVPPSDRQAAFGNRGTVLLATPSHWASAPEDPPTRPATAGGQPKLDTTRQAAESDSASPLATSVVRQGIDGTAADLPRRSRRPPRPSSAPRSRTSERPPPRRTQSGRPTAPAGREPDGTAFTPGRQDLARHGGGDANGRVGATLAAIRAEHAVRERDRLIAALRARGGNVSAAARDLDLSRYQLLRRLRKHGVR